MSQVAEAARKAREAAQARAQAPAPAPQAVDSPYVDEHDPIGIPGTRKVAVLVRDTRSDAMYASTRNVTGGRASRVHTDALGVLGYVHVEDVDALTEGITDETFVKLAEARGFVPKPAPTPKPAKKASDSK